MTKRDIMKVSDEEAFLGQSEMNSILVSDDILDKKTTLYSNLNVDDLIKVDSSIQDFMRGPFSEKKTLEDGDKNSAFCLFSHSH